jgi:hypothetical protein
MTNRHKISRKLLTNLASELASVKPSVPVEHSHPWAQSVRAVSRTLSLQDHRFTADDTYYFIKGCGYIDAVIGEAANWEDPKSR